MTYNAVVRLSTRRALEDLRPEWERLFQDSATTNPFLHPTWLLAWCDSFVGPSEIEVLVVRQGGRLVGVAPFYRRRVGRPHGPGSVHLRVFGTGRHGELTEVPGVLVHPYWTRSAFRRLVGYLLDDTSGWDWVEIPFGHHQGWFEPEWVQRGGGGRVASVIHKGTKPCVVMPLSGDWDATFARLKRNVRESVRRGRNRLDRSGRKWAFEVVGAESFMSFVNTLAKLHGARAAMPGTVRHPDVLANSEVRRFLELVGERSMRGDHLLPCILRVDGRAVAARLILLAGDTMYLSLSGFDPAYWHEGVATVLLAECLRLGSRNGIRAANFGTGVDVSKLRWSVNLERHQDFILVAPRLRSRLAFSVYWQLRTDRIRFDQ